MTRVPFLDVAAANLELRDELDDAYRTVVHGQSLIMGERLAAFETEFARYSGAAHCIGVGNGFDAIQLGLRALGVGPGHDVLVPTNTYVGTWLAVSAVGARPVGVEPIEGTSNLDPTRLDAALTKSTSAVIPVHLYGQPADMTAICEWAHERGVSVLSDAAQAHGALHRGTAIGSLGDVVAWSFYPTKNLGALGDGGGVTTNDPELAASVRRLRSYGTSADTRTTVLGVNSRLDELQAAFLLVKLAHLDEANDRRRSLAARYLGELDCDGLSLPEVADGVTPVWHQFVVRARQRDTLRRRLAETGVETMIHYPVPPFAQPAYAELGLTSATFPIAARLAGEVLSLPIGPPLTDEDQTRVIEALHRCL